MADNAQLRRELGLREAVSLGVGGTIGGGIFVLVGTTVGEAGPAAPLAFVLAFAAAVLIALPYAELASRFPRAGGGYAFVRAALGPHLSFLMGWGFWGSYVFMSGFITLGFGGYLHSLTGLPQPIGALVVIAASTAVNVAGMRLAGLAQSLVVGLTAVALLGFGAVGLPHVDLDRFTPFAPHGVGGVVTAALFAFLAYAGFDMIAAAGEEIKDPERTLPKAILLTLLAVLGVYLLISVVSVGVVSAGTLGHSPAPLATAAEAFAGPTGQRLVAVVAVFTTAATSNAVLVVMSRIAFAMARDGLLPRQLSRVGGRTGTPWAAVLFSSGVLAVVALAVSVPVAAAIGGFLYVVHFMLPLVALVVLRRRTQAVPGFRTPLARVVIPLAFLICAVFLVASGPTGILGASAWLAVGFAGYLLGGRSRRRGSAPTVPAAPTPAVAAGGPAGGGTAG
ncbi:amino acid permease [Micromonospora wenchangensis]|uniref:APC family permease n=1 Tax=Micromonospora wenchangensis TaxID=1185415 RepID=UPI0033C5A485